MTTPTGEFSLEAKYTQERGRVYLSGIQALVRLPLDQHRADIRRGLRTATFISGYRGSPLGGLDQTLERMTTLLRAHVVFSSGLNEDLGATAVYGSQMAGLFPKPRFDGVLGMWYGKAPGVDRTGDVFKHANYAGVGKNGGVLALAGDDPVCKSSTLPSHSEVALYDALMPTIYPGNVQEILDLGLHGFMLAHVRALVGAKIVTNVADEAGTDPERERPIIPVVSHGAFQHQINVNLIPPYGLDMERTIHGARLELARRYAYENKLNRITVPSPNAWLGIVTSGKTYYDVRQALVELGLDDGALRRYGIRILKIGMLFPMEPRIVREFGRGLQEILVVEEKRSFLEMFCKDVLYGMTDRPQVVGKVDEEDRPRCSRSASSTRPHRAGYRRRLARRVKTDSARRASSISTTQAGQTLTPARSAFFCSGCPHNR
jgi:indolepyruvate ferredoxin oxidoreductase